MIDFNQGKYFGSSYKREDKEACDSYANDIKGMLGRAKTSKFFLGAKLMDFYHSCSYRTADDITKLSLADFKQQFGFERPIGVSNCWGGFFFAYCYKYFNLERSKVSRLMNIVDEFGDGFRDFKEEWKPFSWSQLVEMLSLLPIERKAVKPEWTIKQIRDYKQSLKAEKNTPDTPPQKDTKDERYTRFEKWTRKQLCDKIFDLESDYKSVLEELETLKAKEKERTENDAATKPEEVDTGIPMIKRRKISVPVG